MKNLLWVALAFLVACTSAELEVIELDNEGNETKRISANYFDLHPGGNAVAADAVWQDVGALRVQRSTEDSDVLINAAVEAAKAAIAVP